MSGDVTTVRRRYAKLTSKDSDTEEPSSAQEAEEDPTRKSPTPECIDVKRLRPEWSTYADLSTFETWFYIICAVGSSFYACYRVLRLSPTSFRMLVDRQAFRSNADPNFEHAVGTWQNIGPVRDATISEWSEILWLLERAWKHYVFHVLVSMCLRRFGVCNRIRLFLLGLHCIAFGYIALSARVILSQFGYAFTGLVLARLTNCVLSLWGLSVFGLVLLNFPDGVPYMNGFSLFHLIMGEDYHYGTSFVWS